MKTYKVKKGDTLSAIAAAFGVTIAAIRAENPQVKNPNVIHVGDTLKIPDTAADTLKEAFEAVMQDIKNLPSYKRLKELIGHE